MALEHRQTMSVEEYFALEERNSDAELSENESE